MGMRLADGQIFGRRLAVQGAPAGREDHPLGLGLARSFENVQGADDVHLGIEGRPGHRHPHVRLGRQVEDELGTAADHEVDDGGSGDVEVVNGERPPCAPPGIGQIGQRPGREIVDDVDLVTLHEESVHQCRADEPGSTRHHRAHREISLARDSFAVDHRPRGDHRARHPAPTRGGHRRAAPRWRAVPSPSPRPWRRPPRGCLPSGPSRRRRRRPRSPNPAPSTLRSTRAPSAISQSPKDNRRPDHLPVDRARALDEDPVAAVVAGPGPARPCRWPETRSRLACR